LKILDAEGGIKLPREMQRGAFIKTIWLVRLADITDCRSVATSSLALGEIVRAANEQEMLEVISL